MLKELVENITRPITLLLNKTMECGEIPDDWKHASVSPIFKKGVKNRAENYRPISLTSIVCKLMESFMKDALLNHIKDKKLLSTKQHGFLRGRSTATQLLTYLDTCIEVVVNGDVIVTLLCLYFRYINTRKHIHQGQTQGDIDASMQNIINNFPNAFTNRTGKFKGEPIQIQCKPDYTPVIQPSQRIPLHYVSRLKTVIETMVKEDIIEGPITMEEPGTFLSNLVITDKKDTDQIRVTLDCQAVNKVIYTHMSQFPQVTSYDIS